MSQSFTNAVTCSLSAQFVYILYSISISLCSHCYKCLIGIILYWIGITVCILTQLRMLNWLSFRYHFAFISLSISLLFHHYLIVIRLLLGYHFIIILLLFYHLLVISLLIYYSAIISLSFDYYFIIWLLFHYYLIAIPLSPSYYLVIT